MNRTVKLGRAGVAQLRRLGFRVAPRMSYQDAYQLIIALRRASVDGRRLPAARRSCQEWASYVESRMG